jgi:hypothetical protein
MLLTNDLWKKIAAALIVYLVSKNQRIWRAVWAAIAARAWLDGYTRTRGRATERPKLQDVIQLRHPEAKRYFETRGPEFVKTMTDTDLVRLKDQIVEGWDVSEEEFILRVRESYLCSDSRLMAIYRNEAHLADVAAMMRVAAGLGKKMKRWRIRDGGACQACKDMDGEVARLDEEYSSGTMTAHLHPSCRCYDEYF